MVFVRVCVGGCGNPCRMDRTELLRPMVSVSPMWGGVSVSGVVCVGGCVSPCRTSRMALLQPIVTRVTGRMALLWTLRAVLAGPWWSFLRRLFFLARVGVVVAVAVFS